MVIGVGVKSQNPLKNHEQSCKDLTMTQALATKELVAIESYIHINYYNKLKKNKSANNHNTIIDDGIILIIHKYCQPLLLRTINALKLSEVTEDSIGYVYSPNNALLKATDERFGINNYKIVVIGACAAGKTSLIMTYTKGDFPHDTVPTVFDSYAHTILIDGKSLQVTFWDTAGAPDYSRLRPLSYPHVDIFIICMDVYDEKENRHKKYKREMWSDIAIDTMALCQEAHKICPGIPCILVGTKTDCRDDEKWKNDCYSRFDMEIFAEVWKCDGYVECSALCNVQSVRDAMEYVLRYAVKFRQSLFETKTKTKKRNCVIL